MGTDDEVQGVWWLPELPDLRLAGTLRWSKAEGAQLTVVGSFRSFLEMGDATTENGVTRVRFSVESMTSAGRYDRILGEAGSRAYTLERCFRTSMRHLFGGGQTETITANHLLVDVHFEAGEPLAATGVRFGLTHLEHWVNETGITWSIALNEHGSAPAGRPAYSAESHALPDRSETLSDGRVVTLKHNIGLRGDDLLERVLTQRFFFEIGSPHLTSIEEFIDIAGDVQHFASLGSRRTCEFREVHCFHPDLEEWVGSRLRRRPFELRARWTVVEASSGGLRNPSEMWFTLDQAGGMPALARWIQAASRLRVPVRRCMATSHSPQMYISDRILNASAALESLDRASTGAQNTKFKTRLMRCVERAGSPFKNLVPDALAWAERIRLERDEAAHQFGRPERLTTVDSYALWQSLYLLFSLCMMREAACDEAAFASIVNHQDYPRLQRDLAALLSP